MRKLITTIAVACAAFAANGQISTLGINIPSSVVLTSENDGFIATVTGTGTPEANSNASGNAKPYLLDNNNTKEGWAGLDVKYSWEILPTTAGVAQGFKQFQFGADGVYTITAFSKANPSIRSNTALVTVSGFVRVTGATIAGSGSISTLLGQETVTFRYEPSNATKPGLFVRSSAKCTLLSTNSDNGLLKAKNNGTANIFLEVLQIGNPSLTSNIVTFTVTGQTGYRETFPGQWDGNDGRLAPTYNVRSKEFGVIPKDLLGNDNGWFVSANLPYTLTNKTVAGLLTGSTENGIFVTATTLGLGFPDDFQPSWVDGTTRLSFNFAKDDCGINLSSNQTAMVEVSNLSSLPMPIKFYLHDNNNTKEFAINEVGSTGTNGTAFETTIAGGVRKLVTLPTSMTTVLGAISMGTSNFNGNLAIHSINVGFNVPSMFSLETMGGLVQSFGSQMTVKAGNFDKNVIEEISWQVMNPANAAGMVVISSSTSNSVLLQYEDPNGTQSGVVTVIGSMFGSTVTSKILIPVPATPAKVQVIHNSPDAPAVNVWVNGTTVASNVTFRKASAFLTVPTTMPTTVQLSLSSNNAVVLTRVLNLGYGMNYRVIATGFVNTTFGSALDLVADDVMLTTMTGKTNLDIYHSSPNAPKVGVVARGVATLVSDFSYTQVANDVSVQSTGYILDIKAGSSTGATVASFDAPLNLFAGQSIAVLASGSFGNTAAGLAFGLIAVQADGTVTLLPVSTVAGTSTGINASSAVASSVVVSPNPTSDVVSVTASAAVVGLKVYSTTGTLVATSTASSISLGGLSSGLYILEVTTADGVVRKTVVKN